VSTSEGRSPGPVRGGRSPREARPKFARRAAFVLFGNALAYVAIGFVCFEPTCAEHASPVHDAPETIDSAHDTPRTTVQPIKIHAQY
jgi:hypothetical protein